MPDWKISVVENALVPQVWPAVLPYLEQVVAQSNGRCSSADALDRIMKEQAQLWVVYDEATAKVTGALVTRVTPYPGKKYLTVEMLAGDNFDEWIDIAQAALVLLGNHLGCDGIEEYGRRGWKKRLASLGWEEQFIIMGFPLTK